ncbi:putative chalcone--flavonone isomerase 3, partial [Ananas comosus]
SNYIYETLNFGVVLCVPFTGITDIEIHFLQIKYNAIGIYLEKEKIVDHLGNWKGKKVTLLAEDDSFFEALVSVVVIKEIKGSQYGVQLESSVRDRLVAVDKYEEEEEEALDKIAEFFQTKYFKKDSVITFYFPVASRTAEITFATEEKGEVKMVVENANVAQMIQKWYLGGSRAVSPTTVKSLADNIGALLSQ